MDLTKTKQRSSNRLKLNCVFRSRLVCFLFVMTLMVSLPVAIANAEGSRDLIKNGGYRPYLQWSPSSNDAQNMAGIPMRSYFKVYLKAGEVIYLGSSVYDSANNYDILVRDPDGIETAIDVDKQTGYGFIDTLAKEAAGPLPNAGGYTPATMTATKTGVWQVEFPSSNNGYNNSLRGNPLPVDSNTQFPIEGGATSASQGLCVAAWDITVRDSGGVKKPGRVYTNYLALNSGSNNIPIKSEFYTVTNDGYVYKTSLNGADPYRFILFGNNRGFIDPHGVDSVNGDTLYHTALSYNTNFDGIYGGIYFHNPSQADTEVNKTYKIFLNTPSADLPANISTTAVIPEAVQDFKFIAGAGGKDNITAKGVGGTFQFETTTAGSFQIIIDTDNNGTYDPASDRVLQNVCVAGKNNVVWDGKNASGTALSPLPNNTPYNAQIALRGGEYHLPLIDAENNDNGIKMQMLNPPAAFPAPKDDYWVYYNNSNYKAGDGTAISLDPQNVQSVWNPRAVLSGVSSSGGAVKYGGSYGDQKGIDIWNYFLGPTTTTSFIVTNSIIEGHVFYDDNRDGTLSDGEGYYANIRVNIIDKDGNSYSAVTDTTGKYSVSIMEGNATIQADMSSFPANSFLTTGMTPKSVIAVADSTQIAPDIGFYTNARPVVSNFSKNGMEDVDTTFTKADFTSHCIDPDSDSEAKIRIDSLPANGILFLDAVEVTLGEEIQAADFSKLVFTPDRDWNGAATFTYSGSDGTLYSNKSATVTINVAAVNDTPVVSNFSKNGNEDTDITFTQTDFTSHYNDVEGTDLVKIRIDTLPNNGELYIDGIKVTAGKQILAADLAKLVFVPKNDWSGTATFTYSGNDGTEYSDSPAAITINIATANDAPVASGFDKNADRNTDISFTQTDFTSHYSDAEGDSLTKIRIDSVPGNGKMYLSFAEVTAGQEIPSSDISLLKFTANGWSGTTTFNYSASDGIDYSVTPAAVTICISPELSISGSSVNEGDAGTTDATYTFTLSNASTKTITLDYATADGTAAAGIDYTAKSGSLTFAPGETTQTVTVQINGDLIKEQNEAILMNISNITNASSTSPQAIVTIIDDDVDDPVLSINGTSVNEGDTGTTEVTYTLTLSAASKKTITLDYATADGTATAGIDYVAQSGSLTFAPGETTQTVTVQINGDLIKEQNETMLMNISNVVNASVTTSQAIALIINDDNEGGANPSLSISGTTVDEGDVGTVDLAFTFTLSDASIKTVTLDYSTADGTAIAGIDYVTTGGSITFAPGETTKSVTVQVNSNKTKEQNKTVLMNITNVTNALITTTQATGTIRNDDGPTITILENSTAFGSVVIGQKQTRTFTISNIGFDPLILTGSAPYITISGGSASEFSLTSSPSAITIDGNGNSTFAITFAPSSTGIKTAKVSIANNDSFNNPFEFNVTGTGTAASTSSSESPEPSPRNEDEKVIVIVNGKEEKLGISKTQTVNGQKVTTVTVDDKAVEERLKAKADKKTVVIPVNSNADVVEGIVNGETIKKMGEYDAIFEIRTENASYLLPASEIGIDAISSKLGGQVELKDIKFSIKMAKTISEKAKMIEKSAFKLNYRLAIKPMDFEVTCTGGNKTVSLSKFNIYVERRVAIPDGIDPEKITTGVVFNEDGSFSHVPTRVENINGKHYAIMNSLTNSTYTVIWNPIEFKDVQNHWAKKYVNEVGSRLIDVGVDKYNFAPDRSITRAEFASIIVKGLGLRGENFTGRFSDVKEGSKYYDVIHIANQYGILAGYSDGTFRPDNAITRNEAMVMLSCAMKIPKTEVDGKAVTDFEKGLTTVQMDKILSSFKDYEKVAPWAEKAAAIVIKGDIFVGYNGKLSPNANITRAESATIILKLLTKSELISHS